MDSDFAGNELCMISSHVVGDYVDASSSDGERFPEPPRARLGVFDDGVYWSPREQTSGSRPGVVVENPIRDDTGHQFDLEATKRALDAMLVLDARELDIVEENPFVTVTAFCQKWLSKVFGVKKSQLHDKENLRHVICNAVDSAHDDPLDYVEDHAESRKLVTYRNGQATERIVSQKKTTRIVKGNRSKFAGSLAQRVKVKFGNLKYIEANRLMVHRWLSKVVEEEFKDLRTVDKVLALERATFMAFVVSEDFLRYQVLFEDKIMSDRMLARFGASN
jgi:hypothetical protein